MGRSLPLAMAAAAVLLLALVPAPLPLAWAAAPMPKPRRPIGYSTSNPRSASTQAVKSFFKGAWKEARKEIKDYLMSPSSSGGKNVSAPDSSAGVFIFNLSVGTGESSPPQTISGILDITAPTFQPSRSPIFAALPCGSPTCQRMLAQTCAANATAGADDDYCWYTGTYGAGANTTGYLASDTFTFGNVSVPGLVFGCSAASAGDFAGASGVFGFSRGPLSLVSQLQLSWFSYFLASDSDDDPRRGSSFQFGGDDDVNQTTTTSNSRSTPLLISLLYPELYYVNLTGIRVGNDMVDIPAGTFGLRANGSGGVFLSTTMPVTFLEETAYDMVKQAIVNYTSTRAVQPVDGSELGLDLCYNTTQKVELPEMALVFDGAGAVMELKEANCFFSDDDTNLKCLTMLPYQGMSLLGSLLQTGRNMTYDIANKKLIFDKVAAAAAGAAQAAAAPAAAHSLGPLTMALSSLAAWVLLF